MTPTGTQGLAPHHDDVELWVLQTAGRKRWRIYEPLNGFMLPNNGSGDLDQSVLGGPVLEVELAVGDCLYMPRGTVHQAVAVEGADSDHLTISTYQRCSYADLATHVLQVKRGPGGGGGRLRVGGTPFIRVRVVVTGTLMFQSHPICHTSPQHEAVGYPAC